MKLLISILLICVTSWAKAQDVIYQGMIFPIASEKGNIVRFWYENDEETFVKDLSQTQKFVIGYSSLEKRENISKVVGEVTFPRTSRDFVKYLSPEDYTEFKRLLSLKSDAELDQYLKKPYNFEQISIFTESKIEFQLAFGLAFRDENVKDGKFYFYNVKRVPKTGPEMFWGLGGVFANQGNLELEKVKVKFENSIKTDSAVQFSWNVEIPEPEDHNELETAFRGPKNFVSDSPNQESADYRKGLETFNRHFLNSYSAQFRVYYRIKPSEDWIFHKRLIGIVDSLGNISISTIIPGNPGNYMEAMVIPQDFAGNQGAATGLTSAYLLSNNSVEFIYGLNSKDSTNAIVLSWDALPKREYYAGIEITKSFDENEPEIIAILPASAVSYTDFKVWPAGRIFRYSVRPLFVEGTDLEQEIGAQTSQSLTQFSAPSVPTNVTLSQEDNFVRVNWDAVDEPALYRYYVLRGTNQRELFVVGQGTDQKTLLDTSSTLSPRLSYFYTVIAVNLMQDTSAYADFASIQLNTPVDFRSPATVMGEAINGDLHLKWDHILLNDDYIASYKLQRKEAGNDFVTIYEGKDPFFVEKKMPKGKLFTYRVASVSIHNEEGEFSGGNDFEYAEVKLKYGIRGIQVFNLKEGVQVTWPGLVSKPTSGYKIYRKLPNEVEFKEIGAVSNQNFSFLDKEAKTKEIYVYTVKAVGVDKSLSDILENKAIMREVK